MGTAGFANPSFPTLWTPPFPTLGNRCGGLIWLPQAYRDLGIWYPVLSLIATSTWCLGALCSILYRSRFSWSCLACIARFSLLVGKKTLFVYPFCSFFGLPLTATIVPISLDASPFHQIGWAEPYWKKAFVRFRLLMIWFSITLSTKTNAPTAVSADPTKDFGKNPT